MSKFDLLKDVSSNKVNTKIKFQVYSVELGFEKADILIPFDKIDEFETYINNETPKSISKLKKIVAKFGGEVQ